MAEAVLDGIKLIRKVFNFRQIEQTNIVQKFNVISRTLQIAGKVVSRTLQFARNVVSGLKRLRMDYKF